ncbi:MAG: MFS transporter [Alphaproteobacteria bacterium]|nr:MAG: MFS transporter [Alphaproteobacteria bacterium]
MLEFSSSFLKTIFKEYLRTPVGFLILVSIAMPIAMSGWLALLNNFVVERANFSGAEIGWLHTVREIPGFLTLSIVFVLPFIREQRLIILSLITLGGAVAMVGYYPIFTGLMITTLVSSIGFHYFEAAQQTLQLQWLDKKKAPQILGWLLAASSGASLLTFGTIAIIYSHFDFTYKQMYIYCGSITIFLAVIAFIFWPKYPTQKQITKKVIIKKAYWLYYVLQFICGARRQIFSVFAAFMLVEKFGLEVHQVSWLLLLNFSVNLIFAPFVGWLIGRIGEKWTLITEYSGLSIVFFAYSLIYFLDWPAWVAAALYIIDHLFYAMMIAQKTYLQKIALKEDLASTTAVAFTINHIAAVFLPVILGYVWIISPPLVFILATFLALSSLLISFAVPENPFPGNETIFSKT